MEGKNGTITFQLVDALGIPIVGASQ
jgi:hypothetical protein